jgi:hypothetical protein
MTSSGSMHSLRTSSVGKRNTMCGTKGRWQVVSGKEAGEGGLGQGEGVGVAESCRGGDGG